MLKVVSSVLLIIVFLVPGFIFRTVEGQFVYLDKRLQWERFALGLITRSAISYLPVTPLLYQAWKENWHECYPIQTGLAMLGMLLLVPAFLGFLSGVVRQKQLPQRTMEKFGLSMFEQHKIPAAWDHLFSTIETSWVIVMLKDGSKIRGYLGPDSYVSSDHEERDIYISHVLVEAEDGSLAFANDTKGIYIKGEDISTIEFIKYEEEPTS